MTSCEFAGKVHGDMQDRRSASARCALRRNDEVNEWWTRESASVRPPCFFERDECCCKDGGSSLGKAALRIRKHAPLLRSLPVQIGSREERVSHWGFL
jgi:hypothetical protein